MIKQQAKISLARTICDPEEGSRPGRMNSSCIKLTHNTCAALFAASFETCLLVVVSTCVGGLASEGGVREHRRDHHRDGPHHRGAHDDPSGPRGHCARGRVRQVQDHERQRRRHAEDLGMGRQGAETGESLVPVDIERLRFGIRNRIPHFKFPRTA